MGLHCRPMMRRNTRKFVQQNFTDVIRLWRIPPVSASESGEGDQESGLTAQETASLRQLKRLAKREKCTVLLYELVTSDICRTHRSSFVRAFVQEARALGMVTVLDDTMSSIRCGHFFSYQSIDDSVQPDIVLVGKPCTGYDSDLNRSPPACGWWLH